MSEIDYLNGDPRERSRYEIEHWVEELQDRLRCVSQGHQEEALARLMSFFGLTQSEGKILLRLSSGIVATRDALVSIYSGEITSELFRESQTGPNVVNVYIYKLRKILKPYGINIKTLRGVGYVIDRSDCEKIKSVISENCVDLLASKADKIK